MNLYHYCSNEAFVSIIGRKIIRLSSLRLSNDTLEGRLVKAAIAELAKRDGVPIATITRLEEEFAFLEEFFDGLGFCLSENGDLLSQWRGYADDAHGVSIGFDSSQLEDLASKSSLTSAYGMGFGLRKVQYDTEQHLMMLTPVYEGLKPLIEKGALKHRYSAYSLLAQRSEEEIQAEKVQREQLRIELNIQTLLAVPNLFELKSAAFQEEKEWRLVSLWMRRAGEQAMFRGSRNRIIPYREFEIKATNISEVILGPKNITPPHVVESMLSQSGFVDVKVKRSDASYR